MGALVLADASPFFEAFVPDVDAGLPFSVCITRSAGGQARRGKIVRHAFCSPSFCRLAEVAAALPFLSWLVAAVEEDKSAMTSISELAPVLLPFGWAGDRGGDESGCRHRHQRQHQCERCVRRHDGVRDDSMSSYMRTSALPLLLCRLVLAFALALGSAAAIILDGVLAAIAS